MKPNKIVFQLIDDIAFAMAQQYFSLESQKDAKNNWNVIFGNFSSEKGYLGSYKVLVHVNDEDGNSCDHGDVEWPTWYTSILKSHGTSGPNKPILKG